MSEKSLVLAHFVLVNTSGQVDSLDSAFPKQQILDSSKPKEFADDNFEFNENGGKLSEWVENNVGKGELDCSLRAISPFPAVFSKRLVLQTRKNQGLFGKGLIPTLHPYKVHTFTLCHPLFQLTFTFLLNELGTV